MILTAVLTFTEFIDAEETIKAIPSLLKGVGFSGI